MPRRPTWDPAPRVRGKLLGVNVHPLWRGVTQRDHGPLLDLVQRSGANSVRIDVGWASLDAKSFANIVKGWDR